MADDPQESLATALAELEQLRAENQRLRGLLGLDTRPAAEPVEVAEPILFQSTPLGPAGKVDASSPQAAKLALFRSLFAGREDVHATRWENPRTGATGWSPAVRGGWARTSKGPREYLPLTDEVIARHLTGEATVGLYPLLAGDACQLLACDFDGGTWALDALAYLDACAAGGVPAAMERSRSGNGAHVWIFFVGPMPASSARALGAGLLREAMTARAELDLASYDRFFPAQDFLPKARSATSSPFHFRVAAGSVAQPCSWTRRPWSHGRTSGRFSARSPAWRHRRSTAWSMHCARSRRVPAASPWLPWAVMGRRHRSRCGPSLGQCWPSSGSGCHLRWWRR